MGIHTSTIFLAVSDRKAVESALLAVLAEEGFTYGDMKRVGIAAMAAGAPGWTLLKPEPSIVLDQLDDDGWTRLQRLSFRLRCDGFQLDAGEYGFGLLEFNRKGLALESGSLLRDEDASPYGEDETPVTPERFLEAYKITATAPLRTLLRKRAPDHDAIEHEVRALARQLSGKDAFDPCDPDPELDGKVIVFVVPR